VLCLIVVPLPPGENPFAVKINNNNNNNKKIESLRFSRSLYIYLPYYIPYGAGIAQSVERLATRWTTEESEFESRYGREISSSDVVQMGSGPTQLGAVSPEIKWSGREADHSPPSGADVKNTWIFTPTRP
jgi:hypothetical protein